MSHKRYFFIQTLCGALLGWLGAVFILQTQIMTIPRFFGPWAMVRDAEKLMSLKPFLFIGGYIGLLVGILLAGYCWFLMIQTLNPHLTSLPLHSSPRWKKAWVLFSVPPLLAAVLWLIFALYWKRMDQWLYSVPSSGFDGSAFCVYIMAVFALIWGMVSTQGWAGDLTVGPNPQRRYVPSAVRGILYGVVFYFVLYYSIQIRDFLFVLNQQVFHRTGLASWDQAMELLWVMSLQGAIIFAGGFGLAPAFSLEAAPNWKAQWKSGSLPLLFLLAIACTHLVLYQQAVSKFDWNKEGLFEAAGLSTSQSHIPGMESFEVTSNGMIQVDAWPMVVSGIQASENNAEHLRNFLGEKIYQSRYLGEAFTMLPEMDWRLWKPAQAQEFFASSLESAFFAACRPPIETIQELLIWLSYSAPLTSGNRALLYKLSNPERFQIPSSAALYLAHAWLRFGNLKEARQWLQFGHKRDPGMTQAQIEKFGLEDLEKAGSAASGPKAYKGRIEGKVFIQGLPPGQVLKVGLFSVFGENSAEAIPGSANFLIHLSHLVDAQKVGPGGTFRFEHLSQGKYLLAFLVPETVGTKVDQNRVIKFNDSDKPGLLVLSKDKPKLHLKPIRMN